MRLSQIGPLLERREDRGQSIEVNGRLMVMVLGGGGVGGQASCLHKCLFIYLFIFTLVLEFILTRLFCGCLENYVSIM